jgi:hypothetical protein
MLQAESGDDAALAQAHAQWDGYAPWLCGFILHDVVNAVSESFTRAGALTPGSEEYRAALAEVRARLEIMRDFDVPAWRSIF